MKIAFVYLNSEQNIGRGAGYIYSSIREAGYNITFYDTFYDPIGKISREILQNPCDILMISSMTILFDDALKLISSIKKKMNVPVLVGGVHVTILKGKILKEHPEIDYLCIGEGESMVIDFLKNFKSFSFNEVSNLIYKKDNIILSNPLKEPQNLSKLPPFPWDIFRKEQIVLGNGFLLVTCTRGCPFRCTYCCNPIYLDLYKSKYLRMRPVIDVIEELIFLKNKYKPGIFYFGDEMLLFDEDYTKELFKLFKNKINFNFGLMGRVEFFNENLIKFLADCGCRYVAIGVECGDDKFTKNVLKRKISNGDIEKCVGLLKKHNIFVTTYNMIGYPVDYDDSLTLKTLAFNNKLKPDFSQISIYYPFPGTKLYEKCINDNLIDEVKRKNVKRYYGISILKDREYLSTVAPLINKYLNFNSKMDWYFLPKKKKLLKIFSKIRERLKHNRLKTELF